MRLLYVLIGAVLAAQGFMLLEQRRFAERADAAIAAAHDARLAADRAAQAAISAARTTASAAELLRTKAADQGDIAHRVFVLEDAVAELERR